MGTARYCWRGVVNTLVCKVSGRFAFTTHTHADSSVLLSLSLSPTCFFSFSFTTTDGQRTDGLCSRVFPGLGRRAGF